MPNPKSLPNTPKFPHFKWPSLPPFHWIPKVPSASPSNQIHN
ncbi:hypothetical protein NC652_037765 [Populus alba x Populus x berolinensis]|uniref:Uncharacterized protein n=1 Tax=Populus alba x Populus x berolinensis TaxID=444605 RepID=A0AAD6LHH7_9ROSI|nr:hypothetical protein NC652_037272 [Populus alba x Populus x berolinensis]KAJ6866302.1 hypothetical protein NC652_037764 [Populus alba x Populus x berolinensis]KAJ6866303.1 hypothetical protein NC652_037765 [Populus alba x Populus x berolinensis]KAJ6959391.1 hypothetical protein NC653_037657 [Populus alba x Populus x berolinensis]